MVGWWWWVMVGGLEMCGEEAERKLWWKIRVGFRGRKCC